ncbi:molybdenum cofactor guanylyltransferase [Tissierella sp. Yu-01]|uniref:molybdenum cofactor guanylyltransferase n=1 Tax=Tissierella sp. Yu-01 TaxID=3035694 RepID=UPI00240E6082|nr:molybdenum cofactor guanylyltransferase [Tissierella sp. Yu-01]WFA08188.1 molybdenum cofactor guanylyltransferase [Tissierella sp. Yu-01]
MKKFGTAIILAGGKSSRMGFDKQLLKIDERRLMDSLIHKLNKEFDDIIIVTNRPELYIGLSHKITKDILKNKGPLGGIHAGLKLSSSKYAFVVACDMPNINMEYIRHMKERIADSNSYGCVTEFGEWIEPFSSYYSVSLITHIEEYLKLNRRSINGMLSGLNITYIPENEARSFSSNWDMFLNLNTREDLNNYLSTVGWSR